MALLQTTTAEGALKGMVLGRAPHELQDQEAAYLQDCLVSKPGFVDRRGAITGATSLGNNLSSRRPEAICGCYAPDGSYRIMVLYTKQNTNSITGYDLCGAVYDTSLTFLGKGVIAPVTDARPQASPAVNPSGAFTTPGILITTAPSIDGGVLISYASGYGLNAAQFTAHWYGGYGPSLTDNTFVQTASIIYTKESTTITGLAAEIAKLKPGIVIPLVGIVKSIDTTLQASLVAPCPSPTVGVATAKTYGMVSDIRPQRTRGRISSAIGTASITGYGTRFREHFGQGSAQGISSNTGWTLRNQDGTLIAEGGAGTPDVPSDTSLILATVAQNKALAPYYLNTSHTIFPYDPLPNGWNQVPAYVRGVIPFSFAGHQFYANSRDVTPPGGTAGAAGTGPKGLGRSWIGGPDKHYEMDHSTDDGNFFDVPSVGGGDQAVYAGMGGAGAAVICRGRESFAIHGSSVDDFVASKIADDGCLGPNAITKWKGNVIWLGRDGVWMYDGINPPVNLTENTMGLDWSTRVAAFQTESAAADAAGYPVNKAYCFVYRDHLFINITNTGSQQVVYSDGVARTANPMQLMIYLPNNAMSFISNFNFVGYLPGWPPSNQQEGYALLPQDSSTTHYLYPMSNFFKQGLATTDAIITANSTIAGPSSLGPWFHMESRKFDAGDGLWRKTWKQLSTESLITNSQRMLLETVSGLNTTGVRAATPYTGTGLWKALKIRFNARDQYMSFRVYEDPSNRPSSLRLGAWQWGFKFARRGQV